MTKYILEAINILTKIGRWIGRQGGYWSQERPDEKGDIQTDFKMVKKPAKADIQDKRVLSGIVTEIARRLQYGLTGPFILSGIKQLSVVS